MKGGNEFSSRVLNENAQGWLLKLQQSLVLKDYGKGTLKNYLAELTLLFKYCNQKEVEEIRQEDVEHYLLYIKQVHLVGRAKCRSVAQACSYFFRHVMKVNYIVPSALYPKKQFILPDILNEEEAKLLINHPTLTLKEKSVIGLLYGTGMRISEVCNLRIKDIETSEKRIKVYQAKGAKDRYTLLPETLIDTLRKYYIESGKPKEFLFTSKQTKVANHVRSMQTTVNSAMAKAGLNNRGFTAHTLRHTFATHMLNNGVNIHVIKTLLGHSKIETTMIYLHLQRHTQLGIKSPLDILNQKQNDTSEQ